MAINKSSVFKAKSFCRKQGISPKRIDELLEEKRRSITTIKIEPKKEIKVKEISQKPEITFEEKTKEWLLKYKGYMKREVDYFFYEPYLGLRSQKDIYWGENLIQDRKQLFFEFEKHCEKNKKIVEKMEKIIEKSNRY